jgi:acetyl-CoA acetyltransferase
MSGWELRDKVAIVGVGETEYTRWGRAKKSELALALEAIINAANDAGIPVEEIDGFASYANERQLPATLAAALGVKQLRYEGLHWGGGGGGAPAGAMMAMLAVATGVANYVVAYRSLAQGQFGRFGQGRTGTKEVVGGEAAFMAPYGMLTPPQTFAMQARRHMHEYGTTSLQMGAVSVASYKHAQSNPRAVMYGRPITLEDHQNSRMIVDPYRLYDCCQENDGACAVILTTVERARDLKQKPVTIMGASQGASYRGSAWAHNWPEYPSAAFRSVASDLYARAGVGPKDIDVAQIYENFTGMVIMSLEDHGFCEIGEGGPFVEGGRIEIGGELPTNTSGGNLAEAYIHGFELVVEGVRQMRGTSTCQVPDAEICLVAGGPGVSPCSDLVLRR